MRYTRYGMTQVSVYTISCGIEVRHLCPESLRFNDLQGVGVHTPLQCQTQHRALQSLYGRSIFRENMRIYADKYADKMRQYWGDMRRHMRRHWKPSMLND